MGHVSMTLMSPSIDYWRHVQSMDSVFLDCRIVIAGAVGGGAGQ